MADAGADEWPDVEIKAAHDIAIWLASSAWNLVALAHGDESPALMSNPYRVVWIDGRPQPISGESLAENPTLWAASVAVLAELIPKRSAIKRHPSQCKRLTIASDRNAPQEGSGGCYGTNWHSVAFQLFDTVANAARFAFPIAGDTPHYSGTDIRLGKPTADFSKAIKRSLRQFNKDQLLARLQDEYDRACPGVVPAPNSLPEIVPDIDELVTLGQVAPLAGLSKRTLERYVKQGKLPSPDFPGGDGKAHKWLWKNLRGALAIIASRQLPERFPGSRIV